MQIDAGRDLIGELPLGQLGDPARVLDDLHAADDLALGVVEGLAVLGRDDPRQLVGVLRDQLAEAEHHARPARDGHAAPLDEGALGRLHGGIDVNRLGEQHVPLHLPRSGVVHGRGALRRTGGGRAGDLMVDRLEQGRAHGVLTVLGVFR